MQRSGRVGKKAVGYTLYLCFVTTSQKDAAAIPHANPKKQLINLQNIR
jgi:hypothetical protein